MSDHIHNHDPKMSHPLTSLACFAFVNNFNFSKYLEDVAKITQGITKIAQTFSILGG